MKFRIIILLAIAMNIGIASSMTIEETAYKLNTTDQNATIENVMTFVNYNIDYKFYYYPRTIERTWETMEGDCTDKSMVAQEMLKVNGINATLAHGWVTYTNDGRTGRYKHDWLEYENERILDATGSFATYERVGDGIW